MFFEADELAAVVFVVFEVIIKFADFFKIGEEGAGVLIQRGMQPVHGDGKALRPGSQRFSTRGEGAVFRQEELIGEGIGGQRFFDLQREAVKGFVRDGVHFTLRKEDFRPAPAVVAGDKRAQDAMRLTRGKPPFAGGNEVGKGVVTGLCGHGFCPDDVKMVV